jgi:tetratricopeptide (TPR) repeat protein
MALAAEEAETADTAGARQTLQHYLDRDPGNLQISLYLASLQTNAQDYANALKTLESAAEQNPDNKIVRLQESEALRRLHRNDEAAAAARSVLDGADDPEILNDGAYALGETGIDLPLAEEYSRKSIATLEEKSASVSTAEVNSKTFAEANLLIASWDTLGWILFREEKLNDAQPLISAAWRASLHAEVGDHLAQIYEAQGKKDDAATTYALAAAAIDRNVAPDIRAHITESVARLKAAGVKPGPAGAIELQAMRTYKIAKPSGVSGWGTFRLEITTAGVIESQQMTGEKGIAGIKDGVDKMKFPELLPPQSKAHLLRSAVVSCSAGSTCEVVMVPDGGMQTEQQ